MQQYLYPRITKEETRERPRKQSPEDAAKEKATLELLKRAGRMPVRKTSDGKS